MANTYIFARAVVGQSLSLPQLHRRKTQERSGPWNLWETKWPLREATSFTLSRCSGCLKNGSYPDAAVFVYSATTVPTALWTPELLPNGKYAFKGDNGKYLSRCNHCSPNKNIPSFVFADEPNSANPWLQ